MAGIRPTYTAEIKGVLDPWVFAPSPHGEGFLIIGVYHGEAYVDGHVVRTSTVRKLKDGMAYTQNSIYTLGRQVGTIPKGVVQFNEEFIWI